MIKRALFLLLPAWPALGQELTFDPYIHLGYAIEYEKAQQPGPEPYSYEEEGLNAHGFLGRFALGMRFQSGTQTLYMGYHLGLDMLSSGERLARFVEQGAFDDSPLALRFIERRHEWVGLFHQWFGPLWLRLYSRVGVSRLGSDIMPGPEASRLESTLMEREWVLTPEVGVRYAKKKFGQTSLKIPLRKAITPRTPDWSYQTYGRGLKDLSFSLHHDWLELDQGLSLGGQVFHYRHLTNEAASRFRRRGVLVYASKIHHRFGIDAAYSSYEDQYDEGILGNGSCQYGDLVNGARVCQRLDEVYEIHLRGSYYFHLDHQVSLAYQGRFQTNPSFPIYEKDRHLVTLSWTYTPYEGVQKRAFYEVYEDFGFGLNKELNE